MNPDPYDDPSFAADAASAFADRKSASADCRSEGGAEAPAAGPVRKPSLPYGVYPEPPGLRREPWMTDEDVANLPRRLPGQSYAEWLAELAAYVEGLERKRAASAAAEPEPAPAAAPEKPPEPAPASAAVAAPAGQAPANRLRRRHERFCLSFALSGNAARSAVEAGYAFACSRNQGYRLMQRPEIQARVAEIQRGLAHGYTLDAEMLLGKLESVYRQAIEAERFNAAVRVVELQARMAGIGRRRARPPAGPENDDG